MSWACAEIESNYGDIAQPKPKTLGKFGRTANASSNKTTVANFQDAVINETFATTNSIDYIVSTSSETQNIVVEGHTIGADNSLTFVTQTVALTGTTPKQLTTPLYRANRAYIANGTIASPAVTNAGTITVYDSTLSGGGITSGKPDVDEAVKLMILPGLNQSEKCATSLSSQDYWVLTTITCAVQKGTASNVNIDVDVEYKEQGGIWRPIGVEMALRTGSQNYVVRELKPYFIVPKASDVRMVVVASTTSVTVSGRIAGGLCIVT